MRISPILVALLLGACLRVEPEPEAPPSTKPTESSEPQPEPAVAAPACRVEFGPERAKILVAGQPSPIEFEDGDTRLVAYPVGEGEFLVAVGYEYPWYPQRTTTGDSLWRVRCAEPSKAERVIQLAEADFSSSVLSRDGKQIYFSYAGVQRYTIATGKVSPMAEPRRLNDCWMEDPPGWVWSEEFVQGWVGPDELSVLSGGNCGFEAEWIGELHVLTGFDDPKAAPKRRPRAGVGAVATGAGDRLWVGAGNQCTLEFNHTQPATPGVWRSEDAGANWTFLPMKGIESGVKQLWPSSSDPNRVLAWTDCCVYGECLGNSIGGNALFLTTNGGKTWKKILDDQSFDIQGVLVDDATKEVTAFGYDGEGAVVTRDDGRKWTPSDAKLTTPIDPRPRIEIGGFEIEATDDGLRRRDLKAASDSWEIVLRPGVD